MVCLEQDFQVTASALCQRMAHCVLRSGRYGETPASPSAGARHRPASDGGGSEGAGPPGGGSGEPLFSQGAFSVRMCHFRVRCYRLLTTLVHKPTLMQPHFTSGSGHPGSQPAIV